MNELKEIPMEELRRELRVRRRMAWILSRVLFVFLAAIVGIVLVLVVTKPYEALAETVCCQEAAGAETFIAETQQSIGPGYGSSEDAPETETKEAAGPVEEYAGSGPREYLGTFVLTAYCSCRRCCGKWSGGPTASGAMPEAGRTIAVDKRVIPLGTKVYIEGYGEFVAEDTGSAIRGNQIDIYMDSHEAARWFADGAGFCRKEVWIMHK